MLVPPVPAPCGINSPFASSPRGVLWFRRWAVVNDKCIHAFSHHTVSIPGITSAAPAPHGGHGAPQPRAGARWRGGSGRRYQQTARVRGLHPQCHGRSWRQRKRWLCHHNNHQLLHPPCLEQSSSPWMPRSLPDPQAANSAMRTSRRKRDVLSSRASRLQLLLKSRACSSS